MLRTIALVAATALVASAGTATAGSLITGAKVRDASLTGRDVRDRSITTRDLATTARPPSRARIAQVATETVTTGEVLDALKGAVKGGPGEVGPAGPQGPQGAPGVAGVVVRTADVTVGPNASAGTTAKCAADERVVGGGGRLAGTGGILEASYPLADSEQGWTVAYTNRSSADATATAYAVCAHVGA